MNIRKTKIYPIRKKQKQNWQKIFSIFMKMWRVFFDNSKFVGLRLIAGTGKKSKMWSTIYSVFWICCFVYGFWACQNIFKLYCSDKLKTTMTYDEKEKLQFPAITMCTMNMIRRSVMSTSDINNLILSATLAKTPNQMQQLMKIVRIFYCSRALLVCLGR